MGAFIYIPHGYRNDGIEDFCDERKSSCPLIYVCVAQLFTPAEKWNMKQMRVMELGQALCEICWASAILQVPAFKRFSIKESSLSLILFLYSFKSIGFKYSFKWMYSFKSIGQALCEIHWAITILQVPAFNCFSIESLSLILFLYSFKPIGF